MPEYSHIQTYLKCNEYNYNKVIDHFAKVLFDLNLNNDYFKSELTWELSDNGFMYVGGGADAEEYNYNCKSLHIRPYVMGWTPDSFKELTESWLVVSLLFWTEEIEQDYRTGQLKDVYKPLIWNMMKKFSEEFTETGVYLTNEVTDGQPWEALVTYNKIELWTFDAAILPHHLLNIYKEQNEEVFYYKYNKENLYIVRKSVWNEEPWRVIL